MRITDRWVMLLTAPVLMPLVAVVLVALATVNWEEAKLAYKDIAVIVADAWRGGE